MMCVAVQRLHFNLNSLPCNFQQLCLYFPPLHEEDQEICELWGLFLAH